MTLTRRQAVTAAAGAAVALPLARAVPAGAAISGDAAVLTQVARVELVLRYAYALTAEADLDAPRLRETVQRFAAQEAEHLGALATSLEALGAPKPTGPRSPQDLDRATTVLGIERPFTQRTSAADVAGFLLALEEASIKTLELAAARLGDLNLLQTALTILGCQAQHAAVLEAATGRGPVRSALIRS